MSIRSQGNSKNSASVGEERLRVFRRDLKRECLSYVEVLAQSVSVIAPSTVPTAILGLIFAVAGNGDVAKLLARHGRTAVRQR